MMPTRTFVYVSNGQDGDIGAYRMQAGGTLEPFARVAAGGSVGPMAVSPDRRFLYAASRATPFSVRVFAIDPATGALNPLASSPLAGSFPYISLDRTGRFLLGASYSTNIVSVNAIGDDGRVAPEPLQVIPVGRNAHSIRVDATNQFVFAPTLGTDQIFQFRFDSRTGRLTSNTPATAAVKMRAGPRHFVITDDNRFLYVLNELTATVSSFALDDKTGLLIELGSVSGLPADTALVPGSPRGAGAAPGAPVLPADHDIWAADIHLTPDGRFLYISERTGSSIGALRVDARTGELAYLSSTPTEPQPRGFAIDPTGRFMVVSGEKSETISVYALNPDSGALTFLARYPAGKGASWVEFVSFD